MEDDVDGGIEFKTTYNGVELHGRKLGDQISIDTGIDSSNEEQMTFAKHLVWELYQTDNFQLGTA
jgi:hypothetical protein